MELTEVGYDVADGVGTITLNRPDAMNAATFDMADQLRHVLQAADGDDDVRCVVLTGAGRAFCSGDDVQKAWDDPRMEATIAELGGPNPPLTPEIDQMLRMRTPTVAAVNGAAVGIGMDFALACDIRIASEHAKFGQLFVRMGLTADVTGLWLLPQVIGRSHAAELLLTGDIVGAEEAERIGLVSRVVPADELMTAAHDLAVKIAANPPLAVQALKEGMRLAAGRQADELDEVARFVGHTLSRLFTTQDHKEAVQAFLERRPGEFQGK